MVLKLNKKIKAFTLAETMIVLLILSIISAAFLPVMTKRIIANKAKVLGIWTLTNAGAGPDIFFKDSLDGFGATTAGAVIGADSIAAADVKSKLMISTIDAQQYHMLFKQGGNTLGRLTLDTNGNLGFGNITFDQTPPTPPLISNSTAVGTGAKASGSDSTAFGSGTQATGASATALGNGAVASTLFSTTVGSGIKAINILNSVITSVGISSTVTGNGTAIGQGATASNNGTNNSTAIGQGASATGANSTAIGRGAQATGTDSIAIGINAIASNDYSTTIGNATGTQAAYNQVLFDGDLHTYGDFQAGMFGKTIQYGAGANYLARGNNAGVCPATCLYYTSDRRLKNINGEFNEGLDKINDLHSYNYTFKKDKKKTTEVGVMAQDLQKVFPHAVTKGKDGYLMIRQEDMFYSLLNSIKQLDIITQGLVKEIKSLSTSAQRVFDKIVILTKNDQLNSQKIKRLESKNKLIKLRLKKLEKELNV